MCYSFTFTFRRRTRRSRWGNSSGEWMIMATFSMNRRVARKGRNSLSLFLQVLSLPFSYIIFELWSVSCCPCFSFRLQFSADLTVNLLTFDSGLPSDDYDDLHAQLNSGRCGYLPLFIIRHPFPHINPAQGWWCKKNIILLIGHNGYWINKLFSGWGNSIKILSKEKNCGTGILLDVAVLFGGLKGDEKERLRIYWTRHHRLLIKHGTRKYPRQQRFTTMWSSWNWDFHVIPHAELLLDILL